MTGERAQVPAFKRGVEPVAALAALERLQGFSPSMRFKRSNKLSKCSRLGVSSFITIFFQDLHFFFSYLKIYLLLLCHYIELL